MEWPRSRLDSKVISDTFNVRKCRRFTGKLVPWDVNILRKSLGQAEIGHCVSRPDSHWVLAYGNRDYV